MKVLISTSNAQTLRAKLKTANVPDDIIGALETAIEGAIRGKDPQSSSYARHMETAFDEYGLEGVKTQVMYLLINLGKFQGDEARACKKLLKKWASK